MPALSGPRGGGCKRYNNNKDLGCPFGEKTGDFGYTAAHLAALAGHMETLQVLRELECPMAVKDTAGVTAMRYAFRGGHYVEASSRASSQDPGRLAKKAAGRTDGGPTKKTAEAQKAVEDGQEDESGFCVVCLEQDAWWVFEKCGHRCMCKGCMRKQKEKNAAGAGRGKKGQKKKSSATVVCPLCRAETRAVPAAGYKGDVY